MAKELLFKLTKKDFEITYFKASGPGGQHRNKTSSACRIRHPESGAVAEAKESKHQHQNKMTAWKRLRETPKFQIWLKKKINAELMGAAARDRMQKENEAWVEKMLAEEHIRTQVQNANGSWVDIDPDELEDEDVD